MYILLLACKPRLLDNRRGQDRVCELKGKHKLSEISRGRAFFPGNRIPEVRPCDLYAELRPNWVENRGVGGFFPTEDENEALFAWRQLDRCR